MVNILIIESECLLRNLFCEFENTLSNSSKLIVTSETDQFFEHIQHQNVSLVFLDLHNNDGKKIFQRFRTEFPRLNMVVYSYYNGEFICDEYTRFGAKGYVLKSLISLQVLSEAVDEINRGNTYVNIKNEKNVLKFTSRQKDLIRLLMSGKTISEIADCMGVSPRATEKQRQILFKLIGARRLVDFYSFAYSYGFQILPE